MKILMFFHGGSSNRGCEAIVQTAVRIVRSKFSRAYIALATMNPDSDRHINGIDEFIFHNTRRKVKIGSWLYLKNYFNVKFNQSQSVSYHLTHRDIIDNIDRFDTFMSIGGDNYCYGNIPDYYELNRLIKAKDKKLLLWGASLGKEDLNPEKLEDLKRYDKLIIRESISESQLKEAGLTNTELVADGAFLLDKELLSLPAGWKEGNTIGVNYSPLVEQRIPDSRAAVLQLVDHILATTAYQVAFTPHVVQRGNDDYSCMQELIRDIDVKYTDRLLLLPPDLTASQYKGYISRMELFIGARTHATIAAYSTAVPTMVLGYSVKSLGIAQDLFGSPRLVLDKSQISDGVLLIQKFEELQAEKALIKKHLEGVLPSVKELSWSAQSFF